MCVHYLQVTCFSSPLEETNRYQTAKEEQSKADHNSNHTQQKRQVPTALIGRTCVGVKYRVCWNNSILVLRASVDTVCLVDGISVSMK